MKKIIVAGAGHGGLTAAYHLAKNGYKVTVYEKQKKENLGFDWVDAMRRESFEKADIPPIADEYFLEFSNIAYANPGKTVRFTPEHPAKSRLCYMERKPLINHLIGLCVSVGVEFKFETEIISVIADENGVKGIRIKDGEKVINVYGDMVIDAAGMNSPVRQSLPGSLGIEKTFKDKDKFFVYRAYYKTSENATDTPHYTCYFFHNNRNGMDWTIHEDGYIDVLVGGFGGLSYDDINESVKDFRAEYPNMTDEIVRGGLKTEIPLRRTLPLLVANGYALIGNSAAMTEPMSGSGITFSLTAGKILADTLISSDGKTDINTLWNYQYEYYEQIGKKQLMSDVLKNFLSVIKAKDIDYLMESGIMGAKEIAGLSDPYTAEQIINKITAVAKYPRIFALLSSMPKKAAGMLLSGETMPKKYNKAGFEIWKKLYNLIG